MRTGWTVSAGMDWKVAPNLFARAEYQYTEFGTVTDAETVFGGIYNERHSTTENAVRFGIAYQFGGPLGAKY